MLQICNIVQYICCNRETPMCNPPFSFKEMILRRREELNLTQKELADKAGVNVSTVHRIESITSVTSSTLGNLQKVLTALGLCLKMEECDE